MSALLQPMEIAALFLLAPLAIIIGHRRPTGAIIVSGSVATVAAFVTWIPLLDFATLFGRDETGQVTGIIGLLLLVGGLILLLTAWTLALNSAASARRWGWVFLLAVSGYITFIALIIALYTPVPISCVIDQPTVTFNNSLACAQATPLVSLAFDVGHLLGPAVATLYGFLGASTRRRQPLPSDVRLTPLGASADEDTEPGLV